MMTTSAEPKHSGIVKKKGKRELPTIGALLEKRAFVPSDAPLAQADASYVEPQAHHGLPDDDLPAVEADGAVEPSVTPLAQPEQDPSDPNKCVTEVDIPVDQIDLSPYQPRLLIDEQAINDLGLSILAEGQINAIIVRPVNGRYELICGERRWRAMKSINKTAIRAVIRELSDDKTAVMALADNDAREDLSDYERYLRYQFMLDRKLAKGNADIGRRIGKPEKFIGRVMAFGKLPKEVIPMLNQNPGFLSARAAEQFAQFMDSNDADLITQAITKLFTTPKLEVLNALNWLKSESRARHFPAAPPLKQEFHSGGRLLGEMQIDGRKVVITCSPGVTPDELINTILLSTNKQEGKV